MLAEEERLLTAIKKPTIVAVVPDANQSSITVTFGTGPNFPGTDFLVKCVPVGQGCEFPASGDGPVTGALPVSKSKIEVDIEGLVSGNNYTCYAAATLGKVTKCQAAEPRFVPIPPLLSG